MNETLALGIDIGTTTISAAVISFSQKSLVESFNIAGGGFAHSDVSGAKEQNAKEISEKISSLLESILKKYKHVDVIGFTGQMHGIVYCDENGEAVSNLATWQDGRADASLCGEILEKTGHKVSPGFGLATHCYNQKNGLVPKDAASLCTIMDYAAMKLCGIKRPIIHSTNAHSLGFFDIDKNDFDKESLKKLGVDVSLLPTVTAESRIIGDFCGIPVAVAIGDSQAAFFGAVKDEENSALANYGTGSQIACVVNSPTKTNKTECRPYVDGKYLLCGSALCGGRAYAILEGFFRAFAKELNGDGESCYAILNRMAETALANGAKPLDVSTKFSGERGNPNVRGSVLGISEENFTPEALTLGVLYGMAKELEEMYREMGAKRKNLITSGNAARKNPAFLEVLTDVFGMEVTLTSGKEEAATGTALFALLSSGKAKSINEVKELID